MNPLTKFIKDHGSISNLLLVSDLDETMMSSKIYVSDENINALKEFISLGGHFAACSGRVIQTSEWMGVPTTEPSILFNGAGIYDFNTKEMIWAVPLKDTFPDVIDELCKKFPEMGICVYTKRGSYMLRRTKWSDWLNEIERCEPVSFDCPYEEIPETIIKACIMAPPEIIPEIIAYMDQQKASGNQGIMDLNYAKSLPPLIEITSCESNKGVALRELSKLSGTPLKNIIYVGDNLNDLPAHTIAGFRITPANGAQEVKDLVDYITVSNDDHIMVDILSQIKAAL